MARAFRIHASERGFDYRRSSMVAFGGSGPVHALAIARKLRIPRVIFPIGAGVMSALGLLVSPLGFEVSRSRRVYVADLDAASFEGFIALLVEEASGFLHRAGISDPHISTRLDMRNQGQGYEIEETLPDATAASVPVRVPVTPNPSQASTSCSAPGTPRSSRRPFSTNPSRS